MAFRRTIKERTAGTIGRHWPMGLRRSSPASPFPATQRSAVKGAGRVAGIHKGLQKSHIQPISTPRRGIIDHKTGAFIDGSRTWRSSDGWSNGQAGSACARKHKRVAQEQHNPSSLAAPAVAASGTSAFRRPALERIVIETILMASKPRGR